MNAPSPSSSGSEPLIARVWHGVTPVAKADAYTATFISLWESLDAIRRFAGDDPEKARYYPEDSDYLLDLEPFVLHYDVVAAP